MLWMTSGEKELFLALAPTQAKVFTILHLTFRDNVWPLICKGQYRIHEHLDWMLAWPWNCSHFSASVLLQKFFISLTNLKLLFRVPKKKKIQEPSFCSQTLQSWHLNQIWKASLLSFMQYRKDQKRLTTERRRDIDSRLCFLKNRRL